MNDDLWDSLYISIKSNTKEEVKKEIYNIIKVYNIELKNLLKIFLNFIIRTKNYSKDFLYFCENLIHTLDSNENITINYFLSKKNIFNIL
jgi:antitoxin component of RelBE/YafQ-DinJ toxin-antitoxin module